MTDHKSDYEPVAISKAEMRDLFREEGENLLAETFGMLGVDIRSPSDVKAFRARLDWLEGVKGSSDQAAKIVRGVGITAAVTFLIGAMIAGVKVSMRLAG